MIFSGIMMGLGQFRFGMSQEGFQELSRDTGFDWQSVKRSGRAPAQQFTGPGEDTISLSGTIYPTFRGGLAQIELMRLQAGMGMPLMMVSGTGLIFKRWCITQVSDTRSFFFADGSPRQIDFDLSLTAYGEDAG